MPSPRKRLFMRGLFLSIGLIAFLYCIVVTIYVAAQPYTGLYMLTARRVSKVEGPAAEAHILPGDKIESYAGAVVTDTTGLLKRTHDFRKGQTIEVTYKREGATFSTQLTVRSTPLPVLLLLWTAVSAGIIITSYIMYLRRPEDKPPKLFYLESVMIVGAFIGIFSWQIIFGDPLLFAFFLLFSGLVVPLGLHFFLIYPETSPAVKRWPSITAWLYLPMVLYLVVGFVVVGRMANIIPPSSLIPVTESRIVDVFEVLAIFYLALTVFYLVLSVVNVYLTYKRTVLSEARTQIKWVLWGAAVSVLPLALLIAIRDQPIAAEAMGVNNALYKSLAFGVSAMYTGVAGALGAIAVQFVAPDSFNIFLSITFLVGIVIGGLASIPGAIYGAIFIQFVPNIADQISKAAPWAIYGVFMIGFMYVMPVGVAGAIRIGWARLKRKTGGNGDQSG